MARQWTISTDAPADQVVAAFKHVFFTRPELKERFRLSKGAQLRSQQSWGHCNIHDADIAAVLERGGLREAMSDSKHGPGSALGTTIALKCDFDGQSTHAGFWLAATNTYFGMSQNSDVLKAYVKLIEEQLQLRGFSTNRLKG